MHSYLPMYVIVAVSIVSHVRAISLILRISSNAVDALLNTLDGRVRLEQLSSLAVQCESEWWL